MPLLPVTANENYYYGEDEDAPPRLSPNFESVPQVKFIKFTLIFLFYFHFIDWLFQVDTDDSCINEMAPRLIENPSHSGCKSVELASYSPPRISANVTARPLSTGKNNCEMVRFWIFMYRLSQMLHIKAS